MARCQICELNAPCGGGSWADEVRASRGFFNQHVIDVQTYECFAVGMLHAAAAVVTVSMDPYAHNYDKCDAMVREYFGGDSIEKDELLRKVQVMLQQTRCNATKLDFMDSAKFPDYTPGIRVVAFTPGFTVPGSRRVMYAGPSWHRMTDFDRALTFVHETSHACLGTIDLPGPGGYDSTVCKGLSWAQAHTNAKNYELLCQQTFCSLLSGELLKISSLALQSNNGFNGEIVAAGDLEHVPGAFKKDGRFLVRVVGDKVGDKAPGGRQMKFHKVCQYAHVTSNDNDGTFTLSNQGAGMQDSPASSTSYRCKKNGADCAEYAVITDGMNTQFVKMLSKDVGVGLCLCGGPGGRSFVAIDRNATVRNGVIIP